MELKKVVFFTGAGMSAESDIKTFRSGEKPLWENEEFIRDYASVYGWENNRENFLKFYNDMFEALEDIQPHKGYDIINEIAKTNYVKVFTQNVDDLHDKAMNPNVFHLHGKLWEMKTDYDNRTYDYKKIEIGDCDDQGFQLRPNVVLFGEEQYHMSDFLNALNEADYLVCIGTSFAVYPLEMLVSLCNSNTKVININPENVDDSERLGITHIEKGATQGLSILKNMLSYDLDIEIGGEYTKVSTKNKYVVNKLIKTKVNGIWCLGVEYTNHVEDFVITVDEFKGCFEK